MKFCPNCGFQLVGGEKFCPKCGFDLENVEAPNGGVGNTTPSGQPQSNVAMSQATSQPIDEALSNPAPTASSNQTTVVKNAKPKMNPKWILGGVALIVILIVGYTLFFSKKVSGTYYVTNGEETEQITFSGDKFKISAPDSDETIEGTFEVKDDILTLIYQGEKETAALSSDHKSFYIGEKKYSDGEKNDGMKFEKK